MSLKLILILLSIILAVPNFINKDINQQFSYNHKEIFKPGFESIHSIDQLERSVDKLAAIKNIDAHSPSYALLLSYYISERFYQGFSHWKMNENWIAAIGERVTGIGLSCKVQPDGIMKHPYAGCSQQAMILMEVMRRKGIDYRKIGFPHHYAQELRFGSHWYYFDPNMEPVMNLAQRDHQNWKGNSDSLKKYYDTKKYPELSYQLGNNYIVEVGPVNDIPARNLNLFQNITAVLSKTAWCFPLLFLFVIRKKPVSPTADLNSKPAEKA